MPTVTFNLLYVFFVLSLERRRLLHVNVTSHPHASWAAQQIVEAIGFGAAVDYLDTLGMDTVRAHEISLTQYALESLQDRFGADLTIYGPLDTAVRDASNQILKCAPVAVATTKRLMLRAAGPTPLSELLDDSADCFAAAVRSDEGREGTKSFVEKRKPSWAAQVE